MDTRPILNKKISIKDFKEFYWLKEELIKFCRIEGLKTTGGKIEITERIENYLHTGEKKLKREYIKEIPKSKFDWKTEKLTLQTTITDNYKNTENVRNFLIDQIGKHFKFNVKF
ncbi:MAG: SAP domain-containing protein, partial [Crocinitomicaceae bacterium]|nr:SAP domain-containing protein [Crocinitomicaceae bacterium]